MILLEFGLVVAFATLGTLLGVATGIIPGFHANNLALILGATFPGAMAYLGFLTGYGLSPSFISILLCVALVSCAIAHTFLNFVPATFLGAPEGETALTILPAHALLLEGRGYHGVVLSAVGSYGAVLFGFAFIPLFLYVVTPAYMVLRPYIMWILLAISVVLIYSEHCQIPYKKVVIPVYGGVRLSSGPHGHEKMRIKDLRMGDRCVIEGRVAQVMGPYEYYLQDPSGRILVRAEHRWGPTPLESTRVVVEGDVAKTTGRWSRWAGRGIAAGVYCLAGCFGCLIWNLPTISYIGLPGSPLFPALAGIFGVATLIYSLMLTPEIPKQRIDEPLINWSESFWSVLIGSIPAAITVMLPGVTPAHTTVIARLGSRDRTPEQVIVTLCSVNTAYCLFSLLALFTLLRPRTGVMMSLQGLVPVHQWSGGTPPYALCCLLVAVLVSGTIGYFATIWVGKRFATFFTRIPYRKLIGGIICGLGCLAFLFTGWRGLFIMGVGAAIGLIPISMGVRRSHAMGVLLLPIILVLA